MTKATHFFFIFVLILTQCFAWGATKKPPTLLSLLSKYRKAALVQLEFEKTIKSDLNPQGNVQQGSIFLNKDFFRVENQEPEKSLLVYDGTFVWNEQTPSADFPGQTMVTKSAFGKAEKAKSIFVTILSGAAGSLSSFELAEVTDEHFLFLNKTADPQTGIKNLKVKIDKKQGLISTISYDDEIGNQTSLLVKKSLLLKKNNPRLFQYSPPKGAQVTTI